jgi:hypothetical protein
VVVISQTTVPRRTNVISKYALRVEALGTCGGYRGDRYGG